MIVLIARQHARGARHGFTVLELMIAATVLVIGVLSMVGALTAALRLVETNRETALAHQAARTMVERMQSVPFDRIFATYNTQQSDDPGGNGTAPGATFAVAGMRAPPGVATVGTIEFPENDGGQLSEGVTDAGMGMPRDLNGDNLVTNGALGGGYLMLPVRVRVRWRGATGDGELQLVTLLISR